MKDLEYMSLVDGLILDATKKYGEIDGVSIHEVAATVQASLSLKRLTHDDYASMLALLIAEQAHELHHEKG